MVLFLWGFCLVLLEKFRIYSCCLFGFITRHGFCCGILRISMLSCGCVCASCLFFLCFWGGAVFEGGWFCCLVWFCGR